MYLPEHCRSLKFTLSFLISLLVVSLKCEFLPGMLFLYYLLSKMFSLGIFPAGDPVGCCCGSKFAYQAISFHHCVCHELRTFLLDETIRGKNALKSSLRVSSCKWIQLLVKQNNWKTLDICQHCFSFFCCYLGLHRAGGGGGVCNIKGIYTLLVLVC